MRDKLFLEYLNNAIENIDKIEELIQSNSNEYSLIDKEIEDYEHLIENNELNKEQSVYVIGKIHELRIKRRSVKNEHELENVYLNNLQKMTGNNTRTLLLNEIHKMEKQLQSEYKNRIITDEEVDKIMNLQNKVCRPKKVSEVDELD